MCMGFSVESLWLSYKIYYIALRDDFYVIFHLIGLIGSVFNF